MFSFESFLPLPIIWYGLITTAMFLYVILDGFDLGINLQVFDPGVYFSFVETHVIEHGLYMLYGQGLYWLNGDYMEVKEDDFIYMAPYCPQFFYPTGHGPSAYLLYKDVNRDYTSGLSAK